MTASTRLEARGLGGFFSIVPIGRKSVENLVEIYGNPWNHLFDASDGSLLGGLVWKSAEALPLGV